MSNFTRFRKGKLHKGSSTEIETEKSEETSRRMAFRIIGTLMGGYVDNAGEIGADEVRGVL